MLMMLTVLKMLTRTRKRVIRRAILPGITSGGTTKLIQDTTTNKPTQINDDPVVNEYHNIKTTMSKTWLDLRASSRLSSSGICDASESSQIQRH